MSAQPVLSILQYNVMKSRDKVMASLLRDKRITGYDVLAIQEPWRNPFTHTTHNPIPQHFELAYLEHGKTRVCFFINKRIPSHHWTVTHHTPDVSTLELQWGEQGETIAIHNIYNPVVAIEPTYSAITVLQGVLRQWNRTEQLVVGDFNLHHPYWGGFRVQRPDPEAEEIIELVDEHQLGLLYEPGTITYKARDTETTIDLSLATETLQERLVRCRPRDDMNHDSDHIPVETVFNISTATKVLPERWNWERTDKEKLHKHCPSGYQN
jgi:endonuclease/exonuclease/phosphatase family metal-dependent hydrolase